MSQMVLPQTPPQGPKSDSGVKPGSAGQDKNGDSRFDTVSRAEQQRLDKKQAEKRDQARADDKARHQEARPDKNSDKRPDDTRETSVDKASRNTDSRARAEKDESAVREDAAARADEAVTPEGSGENPAEEVVPLTFAGLQALVMPAEDGTPPVAAGGNNARSGSTGGSNGVISGVQAFVGMMAGMPGAGEGKPGQGNGQGPGAGLALTEALMSGMTADLSRTQEAPQVQGTIRFQAAAELASQQVANPNTAKLPADAAALRGYTTSIDVPVNHAEWGDKLVGKLTWLTARNMSVAEIHLTPPDMGPMEVRVQVQQEQANITVHSANPAVRDQLELHSHRLRDMLSEQGLSLEQFDVSDSSQQQNGEEGTGEHSDNGSGVLAATDPDDQDLQPESLDLTWKGEVDIFA
ncbi:flagellar hook-length control protein FliK [Marinobacter sp. HL-58]|uniref:flagellar hook-length control protein FliK n=1 Tax=Marinobacter sp. HL-58 TaxID=1479237 RepID=UPI000480E57E|nr:flagellar hook-length control protein FliK [Marinobacter sp. HL-58]KPQ02447.1 MAG: flagellar hook-length control protein FliK [Marinobacter sp. HL-58]